MTGDVTSKSQNIYIESVNFTKQRVKSTEKLPNLQKKSKYYRKNVELGRHSSTQSGPVFKFL